MDRLRELMYEWVKSGGVHKTFKSYLDASPQLNVFQPQWYAIFKYLADEEAAAKTAPVSALTICAACYTLGFKCAKCAATGCHCEGKITGDNAMHSSSVCWRQTEEIRPIMAVGSLSESQKRLGLRSTRFVNPVAWDSDID